MEKSPEKEVIEVHYLKYYNLSNKYHFNSLPLLEDCYLALDIFLLKIVINFIDR